MKGLRSFTIKAVTSGPGIAPIFSSPNQSHSGISGECDFEDELTDWRTLQDRGLLLYRDSIMVRCQLESGSDFQEALISLHLKDGDVNIEVFLYKDTNKMSITSQVTALELFGRDPRELQFKDRIALLSEMLQKL